MTDPPLSDNDPPEHVLEELLDAFSKDLGETASAPDAAGSSATGPADAYDFDDPSIDRLLGIEPEAVTPPPKPTAARVAATPDAAPSTAKSRKPAKGAVAVDDATPPSKQRSTIVITDFDDVVPLEPAEVRTTVGAGAERLRERRISVRRAQGRRRLRWLLIGVTVLAVPVATLAVLASPLFEVNDVRVQGAAYTDPALIQSIIDDITGEPVLLVDTIEMEKRLHADPWVEDVKVDADFPHRVTIDIRERRPVAAFQGGDGRFRIIDHQSRVLDVIDGIPVDYMLITGDHPDTARGEFAGAPYAAAADLVLGLPSEIGALTESMGLNAATGALSLQLSTGTVVQLGDASDMDEKLARLLTLVRDGLEGVCELDVSTREVGSVPC